jgi:hypothetical protein
MHGTKYQNKGTIKEVKISQLLKFTYWSGMGGDADSPENYSEITYTLNQLDSGTIELSYSRINIATEIETQIFQEHIQSMLEEIKNISEE